MDKHVPAPTDDAFEMYVPGPTDDKVRQLIKLHEGLRLAPYLDSRGYWTVGWGHREGRRTMNQAPPNAIRLATAERLFIQDWRLATSAAVKWLAGADVAGPRFGAIVDMAFNMGLPHLRTFKRLHAALVAHDWIRSALEMRDSKWAREVGRRADVDASMMRFDKWPLEVDRG